MVIPGAAAMMAGKVVQESLSAVALAIKQLYGMGVAINDYIDDHIQKMRNSDNPTVSRTGDVLEAAKYGFGLGYISSVIIMATGQLLLGNTLGALGTFASAATLSNPMAMTCAAVGAIVYGWGALSEAEQAEILGKLTKGLEIGAELIKAVLNFLISRLKALIDPKNVAEFKKYIKEYASKFGKTLHEITHGFVDLVKDTAEATSAAMGNAYDKTAEGASIAADATSHALKEVLETTSEAASSVRKATAKASKRAYVKTVRAARNLSSSPKKSGTPAGKGVMPKAESSTIGTTSGATKVAAKQAVLGTTTVKATPTAGNRPSVKTVAAASKLASTAKKTAAPKASTSVSSGRALPKRAAT